MDSVAFHVAGNPMPKGSFTRMPNGAMLPAGTTASRKRFADWRTDIRNDAMHAMEDRMPSRNAIRLLCEFQLPYPQSSIRKWQWGWWPNIKQPDVDKLLRALLDALTGIVWVDDSQVCFVNVNKVYAWNGKPGAHIVVDFMTDEALQGIGGAQRHVTDVLDSL
jgi:crossover junction endodeoxyribonuclease RusA